MYSLQQWPLFGLRKSTAGNDAGQVGDGWLSSVGEHVRWVMVSFVGEYVGLVMVEWVLMVSMPCVTHHSIDLFKNDLSLQFSELKCLMERNSCQMYIRNA